MAEHFFDTSAAIKHYRAEIGTARVDALLTEPASRHYFSTLGAIEFHSVLARMVRAGHITNAEFQRLHGFFHTDVVSGCIWWTWRPPARSE